MIRGGDGGGNTKTGILFEDKVDIVSYLNSKVDGYSCVSRPLFKGATMGYDILYNKKNVAISLKKHELYRFLESKEINWRQLISKKLLPDDAIYVVHNNTIFIIEIKYQEVGGSVDEKLQTCGFKLLQYKKLFTRLNYETQYIYILNDWFAKPQYKDTLDYIISMGCSYYFDYLPLQRIGLPIPDAI